MNERETNLDEVQIGRILHFVIDKWGRPQCRPAIVVHDWPDQGKPGYVNLQVFTDDRNDNLPTVVWETSVLPNHAVRVVRSWHWPRECSDLGDPAKPFTEKGGRLVHHNHGQTVVDEHNCYACSLENTAKEA